MLETRLLKTFLTVADLRSFRAAASDLHLAPSTVTAQIKALEDQAGSHLFKRLGRGIALTGQGERLLAHARRLVELEASARRSLGRDGDDPGELRVRVSESIGMLCLPWVLGRFRRSFAQTRLTLATFSRGDLGHELASGVYDLALLGGEPLMGSSLEVEALGREKLVVIAPAGSRLAGLGAARPEDLAGMPLYLTRYVWSARKLVEEALYEARADTGGLVECTSLEVVKRCVEAGLGVSVAPEFAVREDVRAGRLAVLEWAAGPLYAPVVMARHGGRVPSPAARAFMESARAFFRERGSV